MTDVSRTVVTIVPQPDGRAVLDLRHPGDLQPRASVVLTDEIIDYLVRGLPQHYSH